MLSEGCRLRIFSHGWGMSLSEAVSYTHLDVYKRQVLTFSPNGDYVRVKPQPGHPTEE